MNIETIPADMQALKQWGLYRREWNEDKKKWNKYPLNAYTGGLGKSNDPETWADFQTAVNALAKYKADGLGFYFANGYVGIDIDHIEDEITEFLSDVFPPDNRVAELMRAVDGSYMEISSSRTGVHAIVKGDIPGDRRRKGNFEIYQSGRFFALTGWTLGPSDGVKEVDLKPIYDKYIGSDKVIPLPVKQEIKAVDLSVEEIIAKAEASKTGARFKIFMSGGWESFYKSQSEADMAFANDLAFWTGKDFYKMDTIFRQSSLYRQKYDDKHGKTTYGQALLNKAIAETGDVYNPGREKLNLYKFGFDGSETKPIEPRSWDDMGNAQRLLDLAGKDIRYSYVDKKWYIYNGQFWKMDTMGVIDSLVDSAVKKMNDEQIKLDPSMDEEEVEKAQKAWEKFKSKSRSNRSKENMIKETQHHVPVAHEEWDKDKMLLNTPSGYVDLSSGELFDHDREKMFSKITGVEYSPTAECSIWLNFLNQTFDGDKDMIEAFQTAVGYSLIAGNPEQVMFIAYGNGRNGKSVALNTIAYVAGSYTQTMQASTLMIKNNQNGPNSDIARLEGARVVFSSETNEGGRIDESLVKQMTGGDKLVARFMYGSEFEFTPKFKIWMATNHLPIIRGTDTGIWRRAVLFPFDHQVPEDKIDKNLESKLRAEASGILNWSVEGCLKWQRHGLVITDKMKDALKAYRSEMDLIENFIDSTCVIGEGYEIKASTLYAEYKSWAQRNNEYMYNSTRFGKEVSKRFERVHKRIGNVYLGLKLRPDDDNDVPPNMRFLKNL